MSLTRHLRVAEIEVNAAPNDERIVGIFRYDSEQKGKRGPLLVFIAEIGSTLYVYEQLLDVINNTLERLRPLVSGVDGDPMARFEKLVQGVNEAISAFIDEEASPVSWNRVNMFLMEVQEEHFCLTGVGHICNIFLQRQPDGTTRAFDLFGSLEQASEVQAQKVFSGLIYGELKTGDILFAGTQNFERLRQPLNIVSRLKQAPPVTAALDIQHALEAQNIPDDFGAIILAQVELEEPVAKSTSSIKPTAIKEKSTVSVERMQAEEKTAEAMLHPAMTPIAEFKSDSENTLQTTLQNIVQKIRHLLTDTQQRFSKSSDSHNPITLTGLRTMNAGHGSSMSRKHKLAILGGISVIIICIIGTVWYRHAQRVNAEQAAWNSAYDQALEKNNQADASLVYGDDDRSLRLLKEAEGIFERLDTSTPKRAETRKTLEEALNSTRSKLRKEQRIDQPRTFFTLPAESGDTTLQILTTSNGKMYTYDAFHKQVISIEAGSNVVKQLTWPDASTPISAVAAKNSALFFTADKKAYRADPLKTSVTAITYDNSQTASVAGANIYGTRIYILDPVGKMVWRHSFSTAIGAPTAYIKQTSANLEEATSIAIDANVYVGFSDGKIVRYLSGAQEAWAPLPLDPPLTNVAGLWTATESDRLVVADATGKRIIVLRKDGKLVSQITSPVFKGPHAVSVDLATKMIFVADGNSIYGFDLP